MSLLKNNFSVFKHLFFWICVFLYFMFTSDITFFEAGYVQLFHSTCKIVIPQIITAYVCLFVLVPKFLNTKKTVLFIILLVVLLLVMYALYLVLHMYFYEPKYYQYYSDIEKYYAERTFWERLSNPSVLLSKSIKFLTPTALLLMALFYKNQQKYLKLNEQKKTAELTALKHQLNPHFLFNTLNNLYALALKKSDQTPEVIEKLSDMLDYMLYKCNESSVLVNKEVELLFSEFNNSELVFASSKVENNIEYYFKNYKTVTIKNFIIANVDTVGILLFVCKLLAPNILKVFSVF